MAISDIDRFPPEPQINGASTLVRNGLMQSDMDAQGFRILHLDTSNLILDELPSQPAQTNKWFNSYNQGTHSFGVAQPGFSNLSGNLSIAQQRAITKLGTITEGVWHGTVITPGFVPTLDAIRPPTNLLRVNNQRITNLGDPIEDQDAVNLRLINNIASGLHPKAAVRAATTENRPLVGTLHPVDGVDLVGGVDRVLVKDQLVPSQNGIYLAQNPGSWTRTTDNDSCAEMETASCFVLEGDTNANTTWFQINPIPTDCTISGHNPTSWAWRLLSRSGIDQIEVGAGLDRTGNTIFAVGASNRISVSLSSGIDIDANYEGQDSITHLGTVDTGTWEADVLTPEFGGTGVNNSSNSITLAGDFMVQLIAGAIPESYLIFDLTGATELILPQLGTLATLAGDETFHNKHISGDQIDSGIVLITHGGTSANTATAAIRNLLPETTGHAGEVLHTDGADVFYWAPATPPSTP